MVKAENENDEIYLLHNKNFFPNSLLSHYIVRRLPYCPASRFFTWSAPFVRERSRAAGAVYSPPHRGTERRIKDQTFYKTLAKQKPNWQEQYKFKQDEIRKCFPKNFTDKHLYDTALKLLEQWQHKREWDRDAR